jgi:hypothetical protein
VSRVAAPADVAAPGESPAAGPTTALRRGPWVLVAVAQTWTVESWPELGRAGRHVVRQPVR